MEKYHLNVYGRLGFKECKFDHISIATVTMSSFGKV